MNITRIILIAGLVWFVLGSAGEVPAAESVTPGQESIVSTTTGSEGPAGRFRQVTGVNPFTGGKLLYLPAGDLYPPYAADPFRVGFGIQPIHVNRVSVPFTSVSRVNLRAGAQVGLVRYQSLDDPELGWQVSVMGGINDQNDVRIHLDNIGWDGHYGILSSIAPSHDLAFKVGLLHVSSHLGDEYIERTGRKRIGYTRQELAVGASWLPTTRWRLYTEVGRALGLSNRELMEPWRAQAGLEYEGARSMWSGRMAWYAAVDLQSYQERDWKVDTAIQTGFVVRSGGRSWRFGVEWYNGRMPIGEFFQYTERYSSIGIWIDL